MTGRAMTDGLMGPSATVEWGTPQDLFDKLDKEFHFTLDVCASDGMQMCARYFNPQTDGLSQEWGGGGSMLDEPTLWAGYTQMGQEGRAEPRSNGRIVASQDRYQVVPGMGPAIRLGGALHQRARKVQRGADRCSVPFYHSDLQHTENTQVWSDGMKVVS